MTSAPRLALALTILILVAAAAPAQATLRVESSSTTGLTVVDQNGFGSTTTISATTQNGNPVYVVLTSSTSLDFIKFDFGPNCSQGSTNTRAVCKKLNGKLNLSMGGGNDVLDVSASGASSASVNLGSLNDTYTGFSGPDNVFTGTGTDDVRPGAGDDDVTVGAGEKIAFTGAGNDTIDVVADLTDVEINADGGSGNDRVSGLGAMRHTSLHGGDGDDTIIGSIKNDFITGGRGVDNIQAGRGNDVIESKESNDDKLSFADTVNCGFDDDDVTADLKDIVDAIGSSGGGTCEEVDRSPIGETPHVRILSKTLRVDDDTGKLKVRLRCPKAVGDLGCKGSLRLKLTRKRKGGVQARAKKVKYEIKAGKRKRVTLDLSDKDVRRLKKARKAGRKVRGLLVSVEKGNLGRKTTIRNPRLKLKN